MGEHCSLTYLGHALAGLNELDAAAEAYEQAYKLLQDLEESSQAIAIDIQAGRAWVAGGQGHTEQAMAVIDEILAWIEANGIAGIEKPLGVYLTIYKVLISSSQRTAADQERARAVLAAAYQLLQEQAASIGDKNLRHTFLNNVKINREIIKFWEQEQGPPLS